MRSYLCTVTLMLITLAAFAQTKNNRLGLAIGGGPQDYRGDLGNGFKLNEENVWRGAVLFQVSYYLNSSFDATFFGSIGDMGYCQPEDVKNAEIPEAQQCPGCTDRVGLGDLNCRFGSAGLAVKYKLDNGYIFKQDCKVKPYVYAGFAANRVVDRMEMNCVREGTYLSFNAGAGVKCYVTKRINLSYQLSTGHFNNDNLDLMAHGSSDMYMQNALLLGIDLF